MRTSIASCNASGPERMRLAIMQPYFFPYLGYFQLLARVDRFVFYDDVNFIKNGWINRNRLLLSGEVRYFTVPLAGASPFVSISQVGIQPAAHWRRKMLESIRQSYAKAPCFEPVFQLVTGVLAGESAGIGELAKRSVTAVASYLGLPADFVWTSAAYANDTLAGSERVLDICGREGAHEYWNLPGGRELYDAASFAARGVELHFLEPHLPEYPQGGGGFQRGLSIVDVLMWNEAPSVVAMLAAPEQSSRSPGAPAVGGQLH